MMFYFSIREELQICVHATWPTFSFKFIFQLLRMELNLDSTMFHFPILDVCLKFTGSRAWVEVASQKSTQLTAWFASARPHFDPWHETQTREEGAHQVDVCCLVGGPDGALCYRVCFSAYGKRKMLLAWQKRELPSSCCLKLDSNSFLETVLSERMQLSPHSPPIFLT